MSVKAPDRALESVTDPFHAVQIKQRINEKKRNEAILKAVFTAAVAYLSYTPSRAPFTTGTFLTKWTAAFLSPNLEYISKELKKNPRSSAGLLPILYVSAMVYSVYANCYYLEQNWIKTISDLAVLMTFYNLKEARNYEWLSIRSLQKYLKKTAKESIDSPEAEKAGKKE